MGNLPKDIKVIVGLSGGVDSSVAALLLKQAGFDVAGVYLKCYWTYEGCQSDQDRNSAARVASVLNIPFEVWDFEKEYRQTVVDYFFEEYKKGRTPNPDVVCNREIKFGLFLRRVLGSQDDRFGSVPRLAQGVLPASNCVALGGAPPQRSLWHRPSPIPESLPERHPSADGTVEVNNNIYIATGHYARIGIRASGEGLEARDGKNEVIFPKFSQWEKVGDSNGIKYVDIGEYLDLMFAHSTTLATNSEISSRFSLFGGVDRKKDQSYFLYDIPREAYEYILYPLGNLTKIQVREIAQKENLPTAGRPDSSGICFIGEVNIEKFLKERIPEHEGNVVTKSGEVIGKHKGVEFYTIGQRHGFRIFSSSKMAGPAKLGSDLSKDLLKGSPLVPRTRVPPQRALLYKSSPRESSPRLPYYVIGKNVERNELVVGMGEECKREAFTLQITDDRKQMTNYGHLLDVIGHMHVRIRNLGEFIPCQVVSEKDKSNKLEVRLAWPVFGVAPGQSAVFYLRGSEDRSASRFAQGVPPSSEDLGSSSTLTVTRDLASDISPEVAWEVVGGGVIQ